MQKCSNCGNTNKVSSNFCRFCGVRTQTSISNPKSSQTPLPNSQRKVQKEKSPPPQFNAPKPYAWIDDYVPGDGESVASSRKTAQIEGNFPLRTQNEQTTKLGNQQTAQIEHYQPQGFRLAEKSSSYQCPRCGSTSLPVTRRVVSTSGWIVFSLMLAFFFPLFWIGFLMKEDQPYCPVCQYQPKA